MRSIISLLQLAMLELRENRYIPQIDNGTETEQTINHAILSVHLFYPDCEDQMTKKLNEAVSHD